MKTVVVTGCGMGIGRGIADELNERGWAVVGIDVDPDGADSALGVCRDVVVGNTADKAVHEAAAEKALAIGQLSGWVNNAGITRYTPLSNLDEATTRSVVEINGYGYMWGCGVAVEAFLAQEVGGAIVNISSIHGRSSAPNHAAYEFTKGGVDALTRAVAVSHGKHGIRANAVAPGAVMTPHLERQIASAADPPAAKAALEAGPPLGRIGTPKDIASAVAFLLSEEASYLSGQSIAVDGAWTAAFGQ